MAVYRLPPDLVRAWPEETPPEQRTGNPPLGRYDASGKFVAYYDRAAIEEGALAGKGLELAWAADPIELFFLQVQGSGRLRAPDGSVIRIGYAGQNGHSYTGIGSLMRERGLVGAGHGLRHIDAGASCSTCATIPRRAARSCARTRAGCSSRN